MDSNEQLKRRHEDLRECDLMKMVDTYLSKPYTICLQHHGDDSWFVWVKEWPGCMSQGDTAEEAIFMIRDAMKGWCTVCLKDDLLIPEPEEPTIRVNIFEADCEAARLLPLVAPFSRWIEFPDLGAIGAVEVEAFYTPGDCLLIGVDPVPRPQREASEVPVNLRYKRRGVRVGGHWYDAGSVFMKRGTR